MSVVLIHTASAIIVGEMLTRRAQRHHVMGIIVANPVGVIGGAGNVNLMPMFTLTVENEYFIPESNLLYGDPMTPTQGLVDAYNAKYAPAPSSIELTTFPSPAPTPNVTDLS